MTTDNISAILGALERVEGKVDAKADKEDIARLEGKVDKTNGRVTELEKREIVHTAEDGLKRTIWKAALAIVTAVAALSAITVAIIDHI